MADILERIKSWISLLPMFSAANILEIIILSVIIYYVVNWILSNRAFTLLKGIGVIFVFFIVAYLLQLTTILWLIEKGMSIAVITLVVVFQPELRKALESLGTTQFLGNLVNTESSNNSMSKDSASQISKAVFQMAKVKTGALIVLEQTESLDDYVKTGIMINGEISTGLIINIFEKNTPLHDGAVIVRGNTIVAATCYLPLSESMTISKDLGTRHRAALGISEVTDSITIVVSEETGGVSYAFRGKLGHVKEEQELDTLLFNRINRNEVRLFKRLRGIREGKNG